MPIRLALLQRASEPLNGLCAQLRVAGFDVSTCHTVPMLLALIESDKVDIVMIEALSRQAMIALRAIERSSSLDPVPVVIFANDDGMVDDSLSWSERIDDIIALPVEANVFLSRLRSVSRLVSATTEVRCRRAVLADFGIIDQTMDASSAEGDGMTALFLGPSDELQFELFGAFPGRVRAFYGMSAPDAIDMLDRNRVDAVIITPAVSVDTLEAVYRKIEATPEWWGLPFLVIEDTLSKAAFEAPCRWRNSDYVSASTNPRITHRRLKTLVRKWRLYRQLREFGKDRPPATVVDGLTGLYSHSFLGHYLALFNADQPSREISRIIAVWTIAGLSDVNEMLGYPEGDKVLRDVAATLAASTRAQDLVARTGGCQFVSVLNDVTSSQAIAVCRRVSEILDKTLARFSDRRGLRLQMTYGVSEVTKSDKVSTLIDSASRQIVRPRIRQAS